MLINVTKPKRHYFNMQKKCFSNCKNRVGKSDLCWRLKATARNKREKFVRSEVTENTHPLKFWVPLQTIDEDKAELFRLLPQFIISLAKLGMNLFWVYGKKVIWTMISNSQHLTRRAHEEVDARVFSDITDKVQNWIQNFKSQILTLLWFS